MRETILRPSVCFRNQGFVFGGLCKAPVAFKSDDCICEEAVEGLFRTELPHCVSISTVAHRKLLFVYIPLFGLKKLSYTDNIHSL